MRLSVNDSRSVVAASVLAVFLAGGATGCSDKHSTPVLLEGKVSQEEKVSEREVAGDKAAEKKDGKTKPADIVARKKKSTEKTAKSSPVQNKNAVDIKTKHAAVKDHAVVSPDKVAASPASQIVRKLPAPADTKNRPASPSDATAEKKPGTANRTAAGKTDHLRPPMPDPRLLLTLVDVASMAPARAKFKRVPLAGSARTSDTDSILYVPEKGTSFGFSLQLFRSRNALETKRRFESLQASYPSSQEISPVSGKTFFSYWNEVLHIGFVQPTKNLTAIVSCGRKYCDSDKLMNLAKKVAERIK